jgi:multidrug efflux pump subunit AcrA (membrane-fusion protein)
MVVVMKIVDYTTPNAMVVSVDMIQKSGDGEFIMVAEQNGSKIVARRKKIRSGLTYNGQVEILEGLTENDKVITVGYRDLNEGEEVRL